MKTFVSTWKYSYLKTSETTDWPWWIIRPADAHPFCRGLYPVLWLRLDAVRWRTGSFWSLVWDYSQSTGTRLPSECKRRCESWEVFLFSSHSLLRLRLHPIYSSDKPQPLTTGPLLFWFLFHSSVSHFIVANSLTFCSIIFHLFKHRKELFQSDDFHIGDLCRAIFIDFLFLRLLGLDVYIFRLFVFFLMHLIIFDSAPDTGFVEIIIWSRMVNLPPEITWSYFCQVHGCEQSGATWTRIQGSRCPGHLEITFTSSSPAPSVPQCPPLGTPWSLTFVPLAWSQLHEHSGEANVPKGKGTAEFPP